MKSKLALSVGVFAVLLLALMIGVMIGFRASPPLSVGAVPPSVIPAAGAKAAVPPAALAHQSGAGGRLDYHPPAHTWCVERVDMLDRLTSLHGEATQH